jgi:hypothetical protein
MRQVSRDRSDALALLGLSGGYAATGSSVPVIYGGGPITDGQRMGPPLSGDALVQP